MGFTLPSFWRASTPPTTAQLNEQRALDATATLELEGAQDPISCTIADGSISPTAAYVIVDTEGGAAADDLAAISNVLSASENLHTGMIVNLKAADSGRVVTVKNSSSANGINTYDGNDYVLSPTHWLKLQLRNGKWYEVEGRAMVAALAAATAAENAATAADHATTKSGTSSTASGTAAKVVTCSGFELSTNARVVVTFSNANTVADALTLNVNGTGAKSVYNQTGIISTSNTALFAANQPVEFRYDGTGWMFFDSVKANALALTGKANIDLSNVDPSKACVLLQRQYSETTAYATTSSPIPQDDTIPQITEGAQVLTCSITPKSASSMLVVDATLNVSSVSTGAEVTVAMFKDSNTAAIDACRITAALAGHAYVARLRKEVQSTDTNSHSFSIRLGAEDPTHPAAINGAPGRTYGGVSVSSISIMEYAI